MPAETPDDLDLLWGADAIAKALNLKNRRQAFHLLESGLIPAKKIGRQWVASRSRLLDHAVGTAVVGAEARA